MDYIGKKCPVCDKYFHADDDIVVCPECGTPHHRECYEDLGHCIYKDRHSEGFSYSDESTDTAEKKKICPGCGKESEPDAFFCKYCASPLDGNTDSSKTENLNQGNEPNNSAFPGVGGAMPNFFMDPLGGVESGTDFGDNITAGETAKYVRQNTPYFVRVFYNITKYNRSKFNFAAALFSGGYMLYRKMYKSGAVVTAIQAAIMILSVYFQIRYANLYTQVSLQAANLTTSQVAEYVSGLGSPEQLAIIVPFLLNIVEWTIMIFTGAMFNRKYFIHCKREIAKIKSDSNSEEKPDTLLQTKGGVNMPIAVSLLVSSMIINYLPSIIRGLF